MSESDRRESAEPTVAGRRQAYLAIKYHPDHRNRALVARLAEAFHRRGVDVVCVARDLERWGEVAFSPEELMAASFSLMADVDVVVIELSEKGVGLGIEAGYAFARSIPIVVLHRAGTDVSTTLSGIAAAIHPYGDDASLDLAAASISAIAGR